MRIISGSHKGRRLTVPKKLPVRPTTDRSKEALFNILQHQYDLENTSVLDLFSGTGSISYEFGSRGVKNIIAVDQNKKCIDFIRKTLEVLGLSIQVMQIDAVKYLSAVNTKFDIIFADPPYDFGTENYINFIEMVFNKKVLLVEGLLILEHGHHQEFEDYPRFFESRKYGSNIFSFFKQ